MEGGEAPLFLAISAGHRLVYPGTQRERSSREEGQAAIEFFTETKTVQINPADGR